ncbi:tRNA-binding protein [Glycomyces xiaoerkulensis]|uniref:tRNA-binding protein n=1 Tax=Glycomyces xiaoerkulensis TaxID=2038139 RepID=UPI000C26A9CA|nr:tRNA-binding protein [Glycomyces xiaoerkulensis]
MASTPQPAGAQIGVDDFFRADIRAGRITRAEVFAGARKPAFKLWIDFGEQGERKSSAQVTARYTAEELVGRTVVAVTNFPPRQIADFMSEVLVLGVPVPGTDEVVLLSPDADVPPGARVS